MREKLPEFYQQKAEERAEAREVLPVEKQLEYPSGRPEKQLGVPAKELLAMRSSEDLEDRLFIETLRQKIKTKLEKEITPEEQNWLNELREATREEKEKLEFSLKISLTIDHGLKQYAQEKRWSNYADLLAKSVEVGVITFSSEKIKSINDILRSKHQIPDSELQFVYRSLQNRLAFNKDLGKVILEDIPVLRAAKEFSHQANANQPESKKIDDVEEFWQKHQAETGALISVYPKLSEQLLASQIRRGLPFLEANLAVYQTGLENKGAVLAVKEYLESSADPNLDGQVMAELLEISSAYERINQLDVFHSLLEAKRGSASWQKDKLEINKALLALVAKELGIEAEITDQDLALWNLKYIGHLSTNQEMLKKEGDESAAEFQKAILKACFEDRFSDFISNPGQADEPGQEIARHNQKVKDAFVRAGVNWRQWLGYQGKEAVLIETAGRASRQALFDQFAERVKFLQTALVQKEPSLAQSVGKDLARLTQQKKNIDFKKINVVDPDWMNEIFPIFSKSLEYQKKKNPDFVLLSDIQETIGHIKETISQIQKEPAKEETSRKAFEIKLWDRDPRKDLFQGNATACCIAVGVKETPPGGGLTTHHPETILQYLTDQGIQVAEVVDPGTGEPIAQVWLFVTLDKNKKPVLAADNFEVNNKYPAGNRVNQGIRDVMFKFLKNYARAANIETVILGKVSTNDVPTGDLKTTALAPVSKLGGYFDDEAYYLEALVVNYYDQDEDALYQVYEIKSE